MGLLVAVTAAQKRFQVWPPGFAAPLAAFTSSLVAVLCCMSVPRCCCRLGCQQGTNLYCTAVSAGTWKGVPAAIKVMYVSQHERALMKNAMEVSPP